MSELVNFSLKTETEGFYNITREVTDTIRNSSVEEGIAIIYCPHTTASIAITENTDPDVCSDMLKGMTTAFPDSPEFTHSEGNSYAHIKSSVMGCELSIIIHDGWPLLGVWQAIYFCEFDGPRERYYYMKIIEC
jgi:secondary thiamine-phosphate synthase enzyme